MPVQQHPGFGNVPQDQGTKAKLMNLIHSIRTVMRFPLIFLNIVVIIFKLVMG